MTQKHTDREYEEELRRLKEMVILMGAKVEGVIENSVKALVKRDGKLGRETIEYDQEVDQLEMDIDELCMRILARRQPVASDLRFITIVLKLVTDLERIGDLGTNICERALELNEEAPLKPYLTISKMAEAVQVMLRDALDAFSAKDAARANQVIERDQVIDDFNSQIFRELLTYMMEDPKTISRAIRIQSVAKYLERIGDHATNLAETIVFLVEGKDIRHQRRQIALVN